MEILRQLLICMLLRLDENTYILFTVKVGPCSKIFSLTFQKQSETSHEVEVNLVFFSIFGLI